MQTSQEELRSANEELQSANEELQSTNEELTTSREEMQSLNEELQTVNNELQAKVDELSKASDDMKNLLNSTDIATVFLDGALRVRRFTAEATRILRLIPGDVGRPISDIASDLVYPELHDDVQDVLRTLVFTERQVSTRDGRWFVVRIMPYRTTANRIDGVVITCMDITVSRVLETELRQLLDSFPQLVLTCLPSGSCDHFNRQWVEYTGIPVEEQIGYGWLQQIHPDDRDRVAKEWKAAMESGQDYSSEFRIQNKGGEYHRFKARVEAVRNAHGKILKWYGANTDIEEMSRLEDALRDSEKRLGIGSATPGSDEEVRQ
jgi:two-component system CheB/CheR fusion protein